MKLTGRLQVALENLYRTFASYSLRADTGPCPCCHSAFDEQRLHIKPLRELKAEDLWQFTAEVILVWGDVEDFKHFLPRIFELAIIDPSSFVDPQVVLNKLHYGKWKCWPNHEQDTVVNFIRAVWESVLDSEPEPSYGMEIEDWLCGIALAEGQLATYLDEWLANRTINARLALAAFIADTCFRELSSKPSAYWEQRQESYREVIQWLRSDAVKAHITQTAADFPEYDFVEQACIALCKL